MIRRPPRSTPFPTRRSSDLKPRAIWAAVKPSSSLTLLQKAHERAARIADLPPETRNFVPRSEEQTSELQSPDHLVCRLLLEKKKTEQLAFPIKSWPID